MQPVKENSVVSKKLIKKRWFLPLAFFPFLLGSYNGAAYVKGMYHWDNILLEPATKEARYLKLGLTIDHHSYINSYAYVTYGGKTTYTNLVSGPRYANAGQRFEGNVYIPPAATDNEELEIKYDTLFAYSNNVEDYAGNAFCFTLKRVRPRLLTFKDLPFSRKSTDGTCAIFIEEKDYDYYISERFFTFDGKGFETDIECDRTGAIPLWNMRFIQTGYLGKFVPLDPVKAELRIFDYFDEFSIGTLFKDINKQYYRSIPLGVETSPSGFSYLVSQDYLSTRTDLRFQTAEPRSGDAWFQTRNIYLPPNKESGGRAYRCKIILDGIGEMNQDSFEHEFMVYRYSNLIGGKINSEYYVTEVEV